MRNELKEFAVVTGCISFFILLSIYNISYPGLHYDELFFTNAALGDLDGSFVGQKIWNIPLYLMEYIGALKAWFYYPIFKIFGLSVTSIRIPVIIISSFGLFLYFKICKKINFRVAWMALALLVLNPVFFSGAKVELGPVVLEFFLQLLVVLGFLTGISSSIIAIICVIGLFNKISFFFWFLGFFVAAFLTYPERRRSILMILPIPLSFLIWWFFKMNIGFSENIQLLEPTKQWARVSVALQYLLDGSYFYRYALGIYPIDLRIDYFIYALIAGGAIYFYFSKALENERKLFLLLLVQVLITLLVLFFVEKAKSYWHFYHILPWTFLLIALYLSRLKKIGLVLFMILVMNYGYGQYLHLKKTNTPPINAGFSTAIYSLIDFCKNEAKQKCISADWGTHTQLLAFLQDASRAKEFIRDKTPDLNAYYIAYSSNLPVGPKNLYMFFEMAKKAHLSVFLHKKIYDGEASIYEIYTLKK